MAQQEVSAILEGLLQAAAERASAYSELGAAFKEMCQLKYDKVYIEMFPLLTKKFSTISETVRGYEKQLVALDYADLAATLRTIQEHESSKLQTTLQLQALRKDYSFRALAFQRASPDDWSVAEGQENDQVVAVAHKHDHTDNGVPQCGCHFKPPDSISGFEGSREEFQAACKQATSTLEHLINEINEQLSDVSCELADLRESGGLPVQAAVEA